MKDDIIRWENPPTHRSKLERVKEKLQNFQFQWAVIDEPIGPSLTFWWVKLKMDEAYEVVEAYETPFGPRTIYARYVGSDDAL